MNGWIRSLFFGNYFYGICVIALSIESSIQQRLPLNQPAYYVFAFVATVLYYTHAYIAEKSSNPTNKRTAWYIIHRRPILASQVLLTIVFAIIFIQFAGILYTNLSAISPLQWCLLVVFPFAGALYYGSIQPNLAGFNLRKPGWLKPFVIGFVWAGAVTVYPGLWKSIEGHAPYTPNIISFLLFTKNFMYISMLCIMFDVKDYAADHNQQVKTFVVALGLRKTIFYILIPLTLAGLGTFITVTVIRQLPLWLIFINIIPFVLLIIVAYSLHQRKSILYYLAIIDGLMLVKAICGIISFSFLN